MSWQIRIEHSTGYRYASPVISSYNEARIIPQTGDRQLTLEATVRTEPSSSTYRYWDYWGTQVTAFDLHTPHTELIVTGRSVVQTAPAPARPTDVPGWDGLTDDRVSDRFVEFVRPTVSTPEHPELLAAARELAAANTPADFLPAVGDWVREKLRYQPGTTEVRTSAVEAWQQGVGVCQDFAHLALVLMRAAGMPARYVSGYQHPSADAAVGETVSGQSHAWVEGWLGEWWGFDPTNGVPAGEQHVVVARGRDYNDVPPMFGVYSGGASTSLGVTVSVTRLG
ncbi:transglutaminase family protein [Frankia sp. Mgl5]|uniref:transglutaminase family protein n=1 Tax=Frankiaceae TaxID=74712 RepID=UPI0000544285|nr:transglutaminase family protein [Frankia sp. Mgl5]ABW11536.1 transglutaminase domain protein [Frankia sp. EAN1pec]MCK9931733.1 transglutaminase family protein [Frankia sp. Mgl5]